MANKGGNRHLKRLNTPANIKLARKTKIWLTRALPGKHKKRENIPLNVLIRDVLCLADNAREVKTMLNNGDVLIDGKIEKEVKMPIGLMDVISLPKLNKNYTITNKNGKLVVEEIKEAEKLCKIVGKHVVTKGKINLVSHDGRNFLVDSKEYNIGDTIKIKVPEQKIVSHMPLKSGAKCLIIKGKHAGDIANLVELMPSTSQRAANAKLKSGDHEFITLRDYLFVIGE